MPKEYERIRDSLIRKGVPPSEARRIAAGTYIGRGKSKRARSIRAKKLHD